MGQQLLLAQQGTGHVPRQHALDDMIWWEAHSTWRVGSLSARPHKGAVKSDDTTRHDTMWPIVECGRAVAGALRPRRLESVSRSEWSQSAGLGWSFTCGARRCMA